MIDTVKRVSGVDFKVEFTGRRPGDPAHIVAACDLRSNGGRVLTIYKIASHALAWERKLSKNATANIASPPILWPSQNRRCRR